MNNIRNMPRTLLEEYCRKLEQHIKVLNNKLKMSEKYVCNKVTEQERYYKRLNERLTIENEVKRNCPG